MITFKDVAVRVLGGNGDLVRVQNTETGMIYQAQWGDLQATNAGEVERAVVKANEILK